MIRRLVVLGASGDLMERLLAPALAALRSRGDLPDGFSVLGVALSDWDTPAFRDHIATALEHHAPGLDAAVRAATVDSLSYAQGDVTQATDLRRAFGDPGEPVAVYVALPPKILEPTIRAVIEVGLPEGSRVAIEKPFGEDLDSALSLNALLHQAFSEPAIFRVDHFLGEQAVQNLPSLRFANRLFEPIWNREHIERVEITWEETLALEGRAGFYDSTGALRDMIQSHLLQVLCFVAMEPPLSLGERDLRDRKVDLLLAVQPTTDDDIRARTVRARYTRGQVGGHDIPSYVDEAGVDPAAGTETFAQVELGIDNWRWAGVPFVLRAGKALQLNRFEIAIHFRAVPHSAFAAGAMTGNVLRLSFVPASVSLSLTLSGADDVSALGQVDLAQTLARPDLPPHARVLLDILRGDSALSVRDDAVEECWRIVQPILDGWSAGLVPLREYAAGSNGPTAE